ncbi:MAG: carbohydrate kinase [Phycisphaerae bacterium]|nr:carbohydrate kinase [Phycisphaerae bacterium]
MGKKIVVGLGEILWDMLPEGRRLGGAPANFAYHSHALGARGVIVSSIGDDNDGEEIFDRLTKLDIETKYLSRTANYPTGTVSVELNEEGQADYLIHSPVAWDDIQWNDSLAELARKCDAVCFGSLAQRNSVSRQTIQQFLQATTRDCLRVFDINIRQDYATAEIVQESMRLGNILKLNDEELPAIASMLGINQEDETKLINELILHYNLICVILTKGSAGSVIYTKDDISVCPGQHVKVADTVGAGDSFTAAAVMGLLENKPLRQLHQRATKIAAYVCTQPGATPVLAQELVCW